MEFWKKENLKNIIPYIITGLLAWLWGSVKGELPAFLSGLFQNISPQLVSAIALSGYLLAILIGWIAYQLQLENKRLKSQPEFIPRYTLKWKRVRNIIDSNPFCMCCDPPQPLSICGDHPENPKSEQFECIKMSLSGKDRDYYAIKNNKPISYKEAYKLVCQEFKIKPSPI